MQPNKALICFVFWLRGQDLNLRPSGYEPDELPGCSTPRHNATHHQLRFLSQNFADGAYFNKASNKHVTGRPGDDLLSRALRQSTIGATGFHGRVRNGIGWDTCAITTWSSRHMYFQRHLDPSRAPSQRNIKKTSKTGVLLANLIVLALAFTHG